MSEVIERRMGLVKQQGFEEKSPYPLLDSQLARLKPTEVTSPSGRHKVEIFAGLPRRVLPFIGVGFVERSQWFMAGTTLGQRVGIPMVRAARGMALLSYILTESYKDSLQAPWVAWQAALAPQPDFTIDEQWAIAGHLKHIKKT